MAPFCFFLVDYTFNWLLDLKMVLMDTCLGYLLGRVGMCNRQLDILGRYAYSTEIDGKHIQEEKDMT